MAESKNCHTGGKQVVSGAALRLSVTGQCNLKCSYCYPQGGEGPGKMVFPDLEELMRICGLVIREFNVVKVRLTGGEPLMRKDIDEIAVRLKALPTVGHVGVTTNGQFLETWAGRLQRAGVDSVNVSLDSLQAHRYSEITGGGDLGKLISGIKASKAAGIKVVKANCVLMRDVNDDEIEEMIHFSIDQRIEVRFLELMSFEGSSEIWSKRFVGKEEILERISKKFMVEALEGRQEQTARMYSVERNGQKGTVGIIGSSDGKMCSTCNRIRITADGRLRRCLKDPFEIDLAGMVRMNVPENVIKERIRAYMDMKERPAPLIGIGSMMRIGG